MKLNEAEYADTEFPKVKKSEMPEAQQKRMQEGSDIRTKGKEISEDHVEFKDKRQSLKQEGQELTDPKDIEGYGKYKEGQKMMRDGSEIIGEAGAIGAMKNLARSTHAAETPTGVQSFERVRNFP